MLFNKIKKVTALIYDNNSGVFHTWLVGDEGVINISFLEENCILVKLEDGRSVILTNIPTLVETFSDEEQKENNAKK